MMMFSREVIRSAPAGSGRSNTPKRIGKPADTATHVSSQKQKVLRRKPAGRERSNTPKRIGKPADTVTRVSSQKQKVTRRRPAGRGASTPKRIGKSTVHALSSMNRGAILAVLLGVVVLFQTVSAVKFKKGHWYQLTESYETESQRQLKEGQHFLVLDPHGVFVYVPNHDHTHNLLNLKKDVVLGICDEIANENFVRQLMLLPTIKSFTNFMNNTIFNEDNPWRACKNLLEHEFLGYNNKRFRIGEWVEAHKGSNYFCGNSLFERGSKGKVRDIRLLPNGKFKLDIAWYRRDAQTPFGKFFRNDVPKGKWAKLEKIDDPDSVMLFDYKNYQDAADRREGRRRLLPMERLLKEIERAERTA